MCDEFAVHYLEKQILDGRRLRLKEFNKSIPHLQEMLERVREETKTARVGLEGCHMMLEEVRCRLEAARRDRAAAKGSYTSVFQVIPTPPAVLISLTSTSQVIVPCAHVVHDLKLHFRLETLISSPFHLLLPY
jgi:hypothetical protein